MTNTDFNRNDPSFRRRLLIVEDEKDILDILCNFLDGLDIEIDHAGNGLEAILKLKNKSYDLILSDQYMPHKTGLDLLRWVRENGLNIPFIIQTGYDPTFIKLQARNLGIFAILMKPVSEEELRNIVSEALGSCLNKTGGF